MKEPNRKRKGEIKAMNGVQLRGLLFQWENQDNPNWNY